MKKIKSALALLLAAVMCLSMAACGSSFEDNVAVLVRGNLNEIYLGQYDEDYMKLVNTTAEDCETNYLSGIEMEAEFFVNYFNIEYPTVELIEEIEELYKDIYSHSKFTVNEPSKLDEDTYAVKLQISPIDIFQLVDDNWDEGMAEFYDKYAESDTSTMTDEEYQAFDADWARAIIDMFYEQMPNLGYKEEQSIAIQITRGEDDVWTISDNDMVSIDELIIYYP